MELVDWELAERTAGRLVRRGPELAPSQIVAVEHQLRELAEEALTHVVAYTGMHPEESLAVRTEVVDRASWARYNTAGMRRTLAPFLGRAAERRTHRIDERMSRQPGLLAAATRRGAAATGRAGRTATGVELGSVLAFLSSHVLGQYETFVDPAVGDGRLLLVAPNIVDVERRLGVSPRDFRMWVCVHEQTHRVQFTAYPWLRSYLDELIGELADVADLDARAVIGRFRDAVKDRSIRGGGLAAVASPQQRAVLDRLRALMTLLEGHADQVMDAVGPAVIPTVGEIRERFDIRRREGASPLDRLLRRLLGMDSKLAQYRVGGAFCREVTERAGVDGMRSAFESPELLPTLPELDSPQAWLARTANVSR